MLIEKIQKIQQKMFHFVSFSIKVSAFDLRRTSGVGAAG